ncbi:ABC transporter permease [Planococcus shenhongbingii]|uniref:ABC transporter permease n=1 Tax=Planococcus shenhongbingii TaxID=3058398 RepID=A0ABT8NHL9_9BACL|nr:MULTISPECIES: ABC transporter permease [unclassified Planococcus (in: firmicutes)]MDN7247326.1 ABC transporter permease [Planococcus sp. N017]WKA59652.1 ABC transporter permease [Planococcus sp. N016]
MKNLHEVWSTRLQKYTIEVQNYLKYVFTGHIAVVLLFAIGAAGYAYSEWVQNVPPDFPGAWLLAVVFGLLLAYSPPTTLLKEADMVYFLPLESKLDQFLKPALKWSFFSQLYLPVIAFVVSLPMVNALYGLPSSLLIGFPILVLLLKWWNLQTEFAFRKARAGDKAWIDRLVRFTLVLVFVYLYVSGQMLFAILVLFAIIIYGKWVQQQAAGKPFAYEHFIALEENRMLRFYQFANYFTDVPHIKGKIKERAWLNWVYRFIKRGPENAHYYLIWRTFIRSDELFYLWVRLTVIAMAGAWLIPFPIAVVIFSAALAFASAIQIWQGLNQTQHFRMDNLFPLKNFSRERAVRKLVIVMQVLQALLIAAVLLIAGAPLVALVAFAAVLIVSAATLAVSKKKK